MVLHYCVHTRVPWLAIFLSIVHSWCSTSRRSGRGNSIRRARRDIARKYVFFSCDVMSVQPTKHSDGHLLIACQEAISFNYKSRPYFPQLEDDFSLTISISSILLSTSFPRLHSSKFSHNKHFDSFTTHAKKHATSPPPTIGQLFVKSFYLNTSQPTSRNHRQQHREMITSSSYSAFNNSTLSNVQSLGFWGQPTASGIVIKRKKECRSNSFHLYFGGCYLSTIYCRGRSSTTNSYPFTFFPC
jgi:hypothetical protein